MVPSNVQEHFHEKLAIFTLFLALGTVAWAETCATLELTGDWAVRV